MLKTRSGRALIALSVALLIFVALDMWASYAVPIPCPPGEKGYGYSAETKQCTDYRSRLFPGDSSATFWIAKLLDSHSEVLTGLATVLLAIVTGGLVLGARDQGKTARAQLRAYVSIRPLGVDDFGVGANFKIRYRLKNVGQTPAFDVKSYCRARVFKHPIDDSDEVLPEVVDAAEDEMGVAIFPTEEHDVIVENRATMSAQDWDATMANDKKRPYITIITKYRDAFGDSHKTRACWYIGGQEILIAGAQTAKTGTSTVGIWHTANRYNDAE